MLSDWMGFMLQGWIKRASMILALLGAAVLLSGCNTISGTIGGVGKDISMIGNTLTGISGDCHRDRCGGYKKRDCGPRGCGRTVRRVVSECVGRGCGQSYRPARHQRASYRERYAYRDRYSSRRDPYCC